MKENHPQIIKIAETLDADRGYDDVKLNIKLNDEFKIKPAIDIQEMRKKERELKKRFNEEPCKNSIEPVKRLSLNNSVLVILIF